ncbi:hypothetical protein L9F63_017240 [Diploptera punctata]|uniref:Uncharacterized protein n=1 Tax=Diploptera punctata TaxID=6984 RepID=A0AAD7ZZD1_DIPPU|nr:hypothetical protein L9F63_017240 [Diploptera punctata]
MAALAACSRAMSATMDYIAGWRHQTWIQNKIGPLPSFLGGKPPDIMALVVTVVPSLLFVMGLEHSNVLRLILNVSLVTTVVFFVFVGSMQADTTNWIQHSFSQCGWSGVLMGTALYSFGFLGFMGLMSQSLTHPQNRRVKLAAAVSTLVIMLLSYCAFAIILSLMYQFRALVGSPVPLLRAFEVRDVDWARLVMAIFSIVGLALALLEVCSPLHAIIVCLGGEDWQVLPRAVAREYSSTGTHVIAILAAGLPAGLAACVCPLWLLVFIMCTGPLIEHAFTAANLIHRYYQPSNINKSSSDKTVKHYQQGQNSVCHIQDEYEDDDTDAEGIKQHKLMVRCLKSGLGFLPSAIRGPDQQQYYTSLSSPVPRTHSNGTLSSESVDVTYIDPDNNSLLQENIAKKHSNHSRSNGTIVTSLSYESMTQGQMDTKIMTNGSVTSLKSIESMIMDQSELEMRNGSISSIKSANQIQSNINVFTNGSIISSKSLVSVTNNNQTESVKSLCSVKDGELCNVSDDDLLVVGSDCDSLSIRRYSNEETALCKEETTNNATDDEDATLSSASSSDEDSESSITDIDAIVAEYKERIQVATTLTGSQPVAHEPTAATGRRVTMCVCGILASMCMTGVGTVLPQPADWWCGGLGLIGTTLFLVLVSQQPRNKATLLIPWFPATIMLINIILCFQLLAMVWPLLLIWIVTGLTLYCRKRGWWRCRYRPGFTSSRRERIRLHAPPRHPTVSTLIPSHRCLPDDRVRRLTQVDTILISR